MLGCPEHALVILGECDNQNFISPVSSWDLCGPIAEATYLITWHLYSKLSLDIIIFTARNTQHNHISVCLYLR